MNNNIIRQPNNNAWVSTSTGVNMSKRNKAADYVGYRNAMLCKLLWLILLCLFAGPIWAGDNYTPNPTPDGPPPPPPDDCDDKSSQPISYYTGAERPNYTDMVVKGVFSIQFRRRYDSQATYDSPLGYGWAHNHDRRLYEYPDNTVVIRHNCGIRTKMVHSGGAYITNPGGLRGTLEEQGDGSYIFTYRTGKKDYFDIQGRLVAIEDKLGNRLEYTYNAARTPLVGTSPHGVDPSQPMTVAMNWQLQIIKERLADGTLSGNQITLNYSSVTGRLQSIGDQSGRTVDYTHDQLDDSSGNTLTAGNLIQVDGLEGVVSSYKYEDGNDKHNLTGIKKDAAAEWVVNHYNADDRVYLQTYGTHTTAFDYVAPHIETKATETVVDADGLNPVEVVTRYCFDDLGYTAERQDAEGYLTIYTRNSDYRVVRKERWSRASDSSDIVCETTADTSKRTLVHAVDKTYDTEGHILTRTEDRGDGRTITTTNTYDGSWVASKEKVSSDEPTKAFRTDYTFYYDGGGNPTNIKDVIRKRSAADGGDQTTTYTYNSREQVTNITYHDGTSLNLEYDSGSLRPTRRYWKDSSGVTQTDLAEVYTYDNRGNQETMTDAAGKVTLYEYDDRNRPVKVTNPLDEQTVYTYNGNNLEQLEVGRKDDPQSGVVPGEIKKILYDSKSRISQTQILQEDASWRTMSAYTYDSRGKRLSVTDANSNATSFGYDKLGRMTSMTDAELHETLFEYNALGQRTRSTQTATTPSTITNYSYDKQGNLLSVTDPNSHVTSYSYDAVGNRLSQLSPDTGTTTYVYDALSNLKSKTNSNSDTTSHSYDAHNRIKNVTYSDTALNVQYDYNDLGQLTSITDAAGTTTYGYDNLGNLGSVEKAFGPVTLNTAYGYDDTGRMTSITYHSGKRIDYTLDTLGRVTGATQTNGSTVTQLAGNIAYQPLGPRTQMNLGDSFQKNMQYDLAQRLESLTMPVGFSPTVNITSPTDGSQFTDADSITFTGTATDQEDGDLSPNIEWRSNVDNLLGTGASVVKTLTQGAHVITATVTDSSGLEGSVVINLMVNQGASDADGDGIADSSDNCQFTSNPTQQDSGGLNTTTPDGIGDACQCGDVNYNGIVDNTDAVLIKRYVLSLPPGVDLNKCNINAGNNCDNTDAVLIQRAILGLPPGLTQSCPAAISSQ